MDEIRLVSQLLEHADPPARAVTRGRRRLADYTTHDAARNPAQPRPRYRSRRATGAWRGHPVLTSAVIAAAAAVAVAVAVPLASSGTTGRQAQPGTQMSHAALTAAILTALGAAADDIVWDHTGDWVAYGQHMRWDGWAWPWEPRVGQELLEHISYVNAPDTAQQYNTIIVQQPPAGSDPGIYGSEVKSVVVDYTSRTWQESTSPVGKGYPQSFVLSMAAIRAEVATGDWSVVGHGVVNGHQAIELRWKHGIGPRSGTETGTLELWVDATNFLPLKEILNETGSLKQYAVDTYQFLPPTPANLATFHVAIPPGFTRYTPPPPGKHRLGFTKIANRSGAVRSTRQ